MDLKVKYGRSKKYYDAGDEFAVENYGIAVCNKNAELLNRVNLGLASVKADGTLDRLVEKWITNAGK